MANIKEELLEHIEGREATYIKLLLHKYSKTEGWSGEGTMRIEGKLEDLVEHLDIEYHDGFGVQELCGYIWYSDGTWSERYEYDGSECWVHKKVPPLDIQVEESWYYV